MMKISVFLNICLNSLRMGEIAEYLKRASVVPNIKTREDLGIKIIKDDHLSRAGGNLPNAQKT